MEASINNAIYLFNKIFKNYLWRRSYLQNLLKDDRLLQGYVLNKSFYKKVRATLEDLPRYIPEHLHWAVHYFVTISRNLQLFLQYFFIRLWPIRNWLDKNLLNVNNKKTYKVMRTLP